MFDVLSEIQNRASSNFVDKIAGLAFLLLSTMIPAYHESESLEDAWTALVGNRGKLFFWYPEPGDARDKWRPSWDQVVNKALPANDLSNMLVRRDDKMTSRRSSTHEHILQMVVYMVAPGCKQSRTHIQRVTKSLRTHGLIKI
ncbi:hypothetical protein EDD85DRAFT_136622 [Armillaria nabsnona]|nr:hypothetical protein EDD85DRAFT_136622 [Armillaria nabsnona]